MLNMNIDGLGTTFVAITKQHILEGVLPRKRSGL